MNFIKYVELFPEVTKVRYFRCVTHKEAFFCSICFHDSFLSLISAWQLLNLALLITNPGQLRSFFLFFFLRKLFPKVNTISGHSSISGLHYNYLWACQQSFITHIEVSTLEYINWRSRTTRWAGITCSSSLRVPVIYFTKWQGNILMLIFFRIYVKYIHSYH